MTLYKITFEFLPYFESDRGRPKVAVYRQEAETSEVAIASAALSLERAWDVHRILSVTVE